MRPCALGGMPGSSVLRLLGRAAEVRKQACGQGNDGCDAETLIHVAKASGTRRLPAPEDSSATAAEEGEMP